MWATAKTVVSCGLSVIRIHAKHLPLFAAVNARQAFAPHPNPLPVHRTAMTGRGGRAVRDLADITLLCARRDRMLCQVTAPERQTPTEPPRDCRRLIVVSQAASLAARRNASLPPKRKKGRLWRVALLALLDVSLRYAMTDSIGVIASPVAPSSKNGQHCYLFGLWLNAADA